MLDAILGFVGKGIDAWTSSSNADKTNEANREIAAQNFAMQREINEKNLQQQREFAQSGVRWKVADAQAAGLHPLAALGAQTSSFSNLTFNNVDRPFATGKTDFGGMGQDIGRAIDAGSSQSERSDRMGQAVARTAQVFSLEKMNLENELLKTSIAKERSQIPPPFPVPPGALAHLSRSPNRGAGDFPIDDKKSEQTAESPPSTKSYRLAGMNLKTNPWFSDAETLENRSGEGWGDFFGSINTPADMLYTMGQTPAWNAWEKIVAHNYWNNLRGGDRSKWSRGTRNMRGR